MTSTPAIITRLDGPAVEAVVARALARRAVIVAPAFVAAGTIGWGADGAISAAYALALVIANFVLNASLVGGAARRSLALMGVAVMFGFVARLALVFVAVQLVRDASWMEPLPLGLTIVVGHLGLLFWEFGHAFDLAANVTTNREISPR